VNTFNCNFFYKKRNIRKEKGVPFLVIMEPIESLVIDPQECVNPRDLVTMVDWKDDAPTVFIRFQSPSPTSPSILYCYDGETLRHYLSDPNNVFVRWIQIPGVPAMDDQGHRGMPDPHSPPYFKIYTQQEVMLLGNTILSELRQGRDNVIYDAEYLGNERIGNKQGEISISGLHGQIPGPDIYRLTNPRNVKETSATSINPEIQTLYDTLVHTKQFSEFVSLCKQYLVLVGNSDNKQIKNMTRTIIIYLSTLFSDQMLYYVFDNILSPKQMIAWNMISCIRFIFNLPIEEFTALTDLISQGYLSPLHDLGIENSPITLCFIFLLENDNQSSWILSASTSTNKFVTAQIKREEVLSFLTQYHRDLGELNSIIDKRSDLIFKERSLSKYPIYKTYSDMWLVEDNENEEDVYDILFKLMGILVII